MSEFRQIRLHGNRQAYDPETLEKVGREGTNVIQCWDGFRFSVIAGPGSYCTPRPELTVGTTAEWMGCVPAEYPGPYTHVEVGFYNGKLPKPWKAWRPYCEGLRDRGYIIGRVTVFPFVPVGMVYDLIRRHGGEVAVAGVRVSDRKRAARNSRRQMDHLANLVRMLDEWREANWPGSRDAMRWVPNGD